MKSLLITLVIWTLITEKKEADIAGEWIVVHSINKKISPKDCSKSWRKNAITFYEDGSYTHLANGYNSQGQSLYIEGKYKLANDTLKLFQIKFLPNGENRPDEAYRVISLNDKYFVINECFCVQGEYDDLASDNCSTKYKRLK